LESTWKERAGLRLEVLYKHLGSQYSRDGMGGQMNPHFRRKHHEGGFNHKHLRKYLQPTTGSLGRERMVPTVLHNGWRFQRCSAMFTPLGTFKKATKKLDLMRHISFWSVPLMITNLTKLRHITETETFITRYWRRRSRNKHRENDVYIYASNQNAGQHQNVYRNSWVTEQLAASQEELSSMELEIANTPFIKWDEVQIHENKCNKT
jgi:hypothetical protein